MKVICLLTVLLQAVLVAAYDDTVKECWDVRLRDEK